MNTKICIVLVFIGCGIGLVATHADEFELHQFETIQLTDTYYSEGANYGDVNRDGVVDIVHGPYWFQGPDYEIKYEIYPPKAQPRQKYADNFFSWIYDFDGDGWNDVFVVGFPGTPAYVYQNPADPGFDGHWAKREVLDWVSNESPQLLNLVGDERPELVCTRDGYFGYATVDWEHPEKQWSFHSVSEQVAPKRFGHALGIGDVNGDGRMDILTKDGWFAQPDSLNGDPQWNFNPVAFAAAGGAEMYAYDVDGDGDNDVITSLAAHDFGLAWYEQVKSGGEIIGNAGCNMFKGTYTEERGLVEIGPLAATRKACPADLMDAEDTFLRGLQNATSRKARHLVLILLDAQSAIVVQFARADWD